MSMNRIQKKLDAYGISESVLTKAELAELRREVDAEEKGHVILDSVLDNPEIIYRRRS